MSQIIKLKTNQDIAISSGGTLIDGTVIRLVNTGTTQWLDVYDSTNTTRVGRHIIVQNESLYLRKDPDQYIRSGSVVRATTVSVEA